MRGLGRRNHRGRLDLAFQALFLCLHPVVASNLMLDAVRIMTA